MNDSAQNPSVNDIWSSSGVLAQNQAQSPRPSTGAFGRPGVFSIGAENIEPASGEQDQPAQQEIIKNETYKIPETLPVEEISEVEKPASRKSIQSPNSEPQKDIQEDVNEHKKVKDLRTKGGTTHIHRVDNEADKTTKDADIKEQVFIEGVETVHSII